MSLQEETIRPQVDQFERDGYLVLPDVLSSEKVDRLNAAIDEVLAEEEPSVAHNIYHCIDRHPELASLIDEPTILPLVVNILGYNIQFFISNLSVRYPNPDDQQAHTWASINWHQDGPNPHFPKVNGASSLYYLRVAYILSDLIEPDRGNTKVIPGSHRWGRSPQTGEDGLTHSDEVQICGKPGDAFLFGQNTWHSGLPNRSQYTRRQLLYGYGYLWMRPMDYSTPSEALLKDASPYRRQLLGALEDNPLRYYLPTNDNVPLKALYLDR